MAKVKKNQKKENNLCKKKRVRMCYSKENIVLALKEVRQGISIAEASRKYHVPESTIRAKKLRLYADKKPGPATVLSEKEEKDLVDWIFYCCKRGFPVSKHQLLESVRVICVGTKKKNPFTNNKPGRWWYNGFLKRHPEISTRVSENVCLNRAKVTEKSLRNWFKEISNYLTAENLMDLEPDRVFNCDEIGMPLNPVPPSVLAPKGYKNVYKVVNNNEKENITVLVTCNAAGDLAPTFILFSGKSLPNKVAELAPTDFAYGYAENGWMVAKNFFEYITNEFEPWLCKKKIARPVILYIDSHSSHITLHLSKFCSEHGIVLIALHTNATHILQPLDVAVFRTVKAQWQKVCESFCQNSLIVGIQKYQFAPLLQKCFNTINFQKILQNGFKKCGLYPFNVNAIDFKKVLKLNEVSESPDESTSNNSKATQTNFEIAEVTKLKVIESLITKEQLKSFQNNATSTWKGVKKDESLFHIWYNLSRPAVTSNNLKNLKDKMHDEEIMYDENTIEILTEAPETIFDYVTETSTEFQVISNDFKNLQDEMHEEMYDENTTDILIEAPEKIFDNVTETSEFQLTSSTSVTGINKLAQKNPLCNITNSIQEIPKFSNNSLQDFVHWPGDNMLSQKKKYNKTKYPSVISGAKWQEIIQEKEEQKRIKIEQAALRKKIRIEKQENAKAEKEAQQKRKEEERILKEEKRLEKEKEKLIKQKDKIKIIEEKRKEKEQTLLKKKEQDAISEQIKSLQRKQKQLQTNS